MSLLPQPHGRAITVLAPDRYGLRADQGDLYVYRPRYAFYGKNLDTTNFVDTVLAAPTPK